MFRLAVASAVAVALLCAAALFLPGSVAAGLVPGVELVPFMAMVAVLVSLVAVVFAIRAMRHAASLKADLVLLARSIDMALREVNERTDRETATLGDMTGSVAREVEKLSDRIAARDDAAQAPAKSDNVVPHPSVRRVRSQPQVPETAPAADADTVEASYRKAVAAGEFDISLQPIVSVARGAAVGFEVFASLPLENGQRIDLRRPANPTSLAQAAAFERILLTTALQAGRKRLGSATISMPLHIAASEALLADAKEFNAVLEMLRFYPDLARSFVLSLPAAIAHPSGKHREVLDLLASKSVRLAAEGWNEAENGSGPIGTAGLSFLKLPANRLLDRERARRKVTAAQTIIERAAAENLEIVATEVTADEDAVSLIDLGIDLMSGPRFGGPKRFKSDGGRPGRLALV